MQESRSMIEMSLFIGNLSQSVRERDFEAAFRRYGRNHVEIKDGYGFVVFETVKDAKRALNGLQGRRICGERPSIEWAKKQIPFRKFLAENTERVAHKKSSRGEDSEERRFSRDRGLHESGKRRKAGNDEKHWPKEDCREGSSRDNSHFRDELQISENPNQDHIEHENMIYGEDDIDGDLARKGIGDLEVRNESENDSKLQKHSEDSRNRMVASIEVEGQESQQRLVDIVSDEEIRREAKAKEKHAKSRAHRSPVRDNSVNGVQRKKARIMEQERRDQSTHGKSQIGCYICGQQGHVMRNCRARVRREGYGRMRHGKNVDRGFRVSDTKKDRMYRELDTRRKYSSRRSTYSPYQDRCLRDKETNSSRLLSAAEDRDELQGQRESHSYKHHRHRHHQTKSRHDRDHDRSRKRLRKRSPSCSSWKLRRCHSVLSPSQAQSHSSFLSQSQSRSQSRPRSGSPPQSRAQPQSRSLSASKSCSPSQSRSPSHSQSRSRSLLHSSSKSLTSRSKSSNARTRSRSWQCRTLESDSASSKSHGSSSRLKSHSSRPPKSRCTSHSKSSMTHSQSPQFDEPAQHQKASQIMDSVSQAEWQSPCNSSSPCVDVLEKQAREDPRIVLATHQNVSDAKDKQVYRDMKRPPTSRALDEVNVPERHLFLPHAAEIEYHDEMQPDQCYTTDILMELKSEDKPFSLNRELTSSFEQHVLNASGDEQKNLGNDVVQCTLKEQLEKGSLSEQLEKASLSEYMNEGKGPSFIFMDDAIRTGSWYEQRLNEREAVEYVREQYRPETLIKIDEIEAYHNPKFYEGSHKKESARHAIVDWSHDKSPNMSLESSKKNFKGVEKQDSKPSEAASCKSNVVATTNILNQDQTSQSISRENIRVDHISTLDANVISTVEGILPVICQKSSHSIHFDAARLWPWEAIWIRRMKRGPVSAGNYEKRKAQNEEFGIVDSYIRSSSGWWED
ncbi:hypothetical protein O6H91_04G066400 [Diphasiastrum complanatum]|uniref:Uncharacterized protein n=1 Tax=Diphasiastrum complanatum TaxID=34168 RepID=A0ACC2DXV8_DIPCM|nr:hypothetical protein O6H91_04G066400 [Diphasiastrum complanatum]